MAAHTCRLFVCPRLTRRALQTASNKVAFKRILPNEACPRFLHTPTANRVNTKLLQQKYSTMPKNEITKLTENRQQKMQMAIKEIMTELDRDTLPTGLRQLSDPQLRDRVACVVLLMIQKKFAPRQVVHYLGNYPELLIHTDQSWSTAMQLAEEFGFTDTLTIPALFHIPHFFSGNSKALTIQFDGLRALGFYESQIAKMIMDHPEILNQDMRKMLTNHQELLQYYPKADLTKMILRSPIILTTPASESNAKLKYAKDIMGIPVKHISKSNYLRYDLLHIETRHMFLERAGLYEKPDKHGVSNVENPTFKNIIDTDERYFAKKVAHLTLEEYRTFEKLYSQEKTDVLEEYFSEDEFDDDELDELS